MKILIFLVWDILVQGSTFYFVMLKGKCANNELKKFQNDRKKVKNIIFCIRFQNVISVCF